MTTSLLIAVLGLGVAWTLAWMLRRSHRSRQQAAADLHEQRERFRLTLASIGDGVIATDTEGKVTFLNPVAQALTGWTQDEAAGTPLITVFNIVNEDTRLPVDNPALRALKEDRIVGLANHTFLISKSGDECPIDDSAAPIRDEDGNITGAVLVFSDVTERRQLERVSAERLSMVSRLASIVDSSEDAIIGKSLDGTILSWNAASERLFGYKAEQVIGQNISMLIPADRTDEEGRIIARLCAGERVESYDTLRLRSDGQLVSVSLTVSPVKDADGRVVGASKIVRDITARRESEERLRQNEQFNRSLMDGTADCVKVLDMDGRVLHMNTPGLCAMEIDDFGTVCGQEWETLWPAQARDNIDRSIRGAVGGEVSSFEAYCPTAKGTPKWWEVTVGPVRDAEGGNVVRLLSVSRDITERKQVDRALLESEERMRAATVAVSDLIWTNSAEGLMEGEQKSWEDFTGQSRDEYQGYGWSKVVHPDDAQPTIDAWTRAVAGKHTFIFEHRLRRRDGEWRLCSVRAVPIINADNTIREWVGVHSDITERKRDEQQLRQLAAELSESGHRKDEFLATLAHELRNPLAPIRTGLQLMKLAAGQEATIEQARSMVERQVTQMVRLVDELMDVSRISRGVLELRKERVALADIVDNALETSSSLIEQMGHRLTVSVPDRTLAIDGDLTRLAQVIVNLLNNAAKYSDRGGHIWLTVERQGSDAVVSVKDSGIGMPANQLPRIFELFTQIDSSMEKSQGGLGIGLTLVKRLVEMHGGSVEARSEGSGKGSEFIVRLPIAADGLIGSQPGAVPQENRVKSSHRILVVEDNRDGADSISAMLRLLGNDTRTAYDGEEGVLVAGQFRPKVILLDIGLPKLNGYEACRRIRLQSWGKEIVLIAVTGWGQDDDRRRSQEAGFDHHLVKPVDPQALMKLLAGLPVENS